MAGLPDSVAFALALACAALMGLAIQRGSTCTVAAVEEWLATRRLTRLAALVEASLWVGAGLLLARLAGHTMVLPPGYAPGAWTLAGAALLGSGAVLNQACVFGTVARLGSGQWAYVATPLGFYLGSASAGRLFAAPMPMALGTVPPLGAWPVAAAGLLGAALLWRAVALFAARGARCAGWSPHNATLVIGLAFAALLALVGAWTYTDLLAEMARGMAQGLPARATLGGALLAGALAGGWQGGKLQWHGLAPATLLRCAGGGLLMGWGSALIPGGNDGLVLVGMPLGWPYAWLAFGTMVLSIAAALRLQGALAR